MKRATGKHPGRKPQVLPLERSAEEDSSGEIVERPDGYHWIAPDGRQEFGPFETLELAQAYRDEYDEDAPDPGETLQEAEAEIGLSDWIDPETGEPAEGPCPPHLEGE
jgi:hypothetical protein